MNGIVQEKVQGLERVVQQITSHVFGSPVSVCLDLRWDKKPPVDVKASVYTLVGEYASLNVSFLMPCYSFHSSGVVDYERKVQRIVEELYGRADADTVQNSRKLLGYFMRDSEIPDALVRHMPNVFHIAGGMMQIVRTLYTSPSIRLEKVGNNLFSGNEEKLSRVYDELSGFYQGFLSGDAEEL